MRVISSSLLFVALALLYDRLMSLLFVRSENPRKKSFIQVFFKYRDFFLFSILQQKICLL